MSATIRQVGHSLCQHVALARWYLGGRKGTPPPVFKQHLVKSYARLFGLQVLLETGTMTGDMLAACREAFEQLYSIELDMDLFLRAKERFRNDPRVTLVPGDSAQVLKTVLKAIDKPCLIWLDAHVMAGRWDGRQAVTPIEAELAQVFDSGLTDYVLLIDDARLFGKEGYPTLQEIKTSILSQHPDWVVEVKDDVIRAHRHAPMES